MNAVTNKIETILKNSYNTKKYVDLVQEIFPKINIVAPDKFRNEFTNFSSHIEGSIHVGNYKTPDKKNIIIMAVQLKNAGYVENSRSTQRSYAKKLIENANADAAFIAFYTEGEPKWRLSFVRLDYEMKIENGRLKTTENLTPAKRYSYLVGGNDTYHEPCHTAISRFERLILDSMADSEHPTLDDLENAFSVEKVTDEFFKLYCEKFHQLREKLEENEDFRIEAQQHNFTSAQFAKKLMGQIVFLYFLQKKGWLGVGAWPNTLTEKEYNRAYHARGAKSRELIPIVYRPVGDGIYRISSTGLNTISDADEAVLAMCVKGKPWGSGPHNFMRRLFEIAEKKNQNFFDELLEPLFYDALNVNRGEQGYCPALHCRIPFLSGGLFEPIDGYDWEHNNFNIPNDIFSNVATKGREADGILDIFDRYNFTMSEDEPMEREVAIDPEMLGKVFENLLEVNDRKSKGAFYTPREIVHYMCQESLINYLTNTLQIEEEAIREFILYGDFMKDEDTVKEKRQGNGGMYISESLFKLDVDGNVVVDRLKDVDEALKNVRVADPAVGSGAFPLGMLNEIVRARQNISAYMAITMNAYDTRLMYQMERSPHNLKYETIKNCIFAADIEPSAVDIAQLRLWLSLVIDDEINPNAQSALDGHKNPLPLPNLESNILCGNSLIDEFEGTALINESSLLGNITENSQINMNQGRFDAVLSKLIEKQNELFYCDNTEKKKQLKEEIEALRDTIIMAQLQGCTPDKIQRYYESKRMAAKPYVLWQLDFARVFREKGGFDIVIGNPPYGANIDSLIRIYERKYPKTSHGFKDIYKYFIDISLSTLANRNGILSFITPNTYLMQPRYKDVRIVLLDASIIEIINLGEGVFDAVVPTAIMIVSKKSNTGDNTVCFMDASKDSKFSGDIQKSRRAFITQQYYLSTPNNIFTDKINEKAHDELYWEEVVEMKDAGINYQRVKVGLAEKGKSDLSDRLLYEGEKESPSHVEFWKGVDINEFYIAQSTHRYVRPNIEIRANERVILNEKYFAIAPKLIWRQTASYPIAVVDYQGIWFGRSIQAGTIKKEYENKMSYEYLACLLNSNYIRSIYIDSVKESGKVFPQVKLTKLKTLPVKNISLQEQDKFREIYHELSHSEFKTELMKKLNDMVYDLYLVSSEEQNRIEESVVS